MMLAAGYFRIRNALPGPMWMYPLSYVAFHTYSIQASKFTRSFYYIKSNLLAFDSEFPGIGQKQSSKPHTFDFLLNDRVNVNSFSCCRASWRMST